MGARRIGLIELERLRRRHRKTLAGIAQEAGMNVCAVWRVMRQKSFDIRQIAKVARVIGVPIDRIDLGSFLREQGCDVAQRARAEHAQADEGAA